MENVGWQGLGPYSASIKMAEKEIKEMAKKVNDLCGMWQEIFFIPFSLPLPPSLPPPPLSPTPPQLVRFNKP